MSNDLPKDVFRLTELFVHNKKKLHALRAKNVQREKVADDSKKTSKRAKNLSVRPTKHHTTG